MNQVSHGLGNKSAQLTCSCSSWKKTDTRRAVPMDRMVSFLKKAPMTHKSNFWWSGLVRNKWQQASEKLYVSGPFDTKPLTYPLRIDPHSRDA